MSRRGYYYKNNKYISYKQYTHLSLKQITKKEEELEIKKADAEKNLFGLINIGSLHDRLIEEIKPTMQNKEKFINSLIENYNLSLKKSKPFFAKIMYVNPYEEDKPRLLSMEREIKYQVDSLKKLIQDKVKEIYSEFPNYKFLKRKIFDKSFEERSIDLIKNEINFCTRKLPYITVDHTYSGWTEIKIIEEFHRGRYHVHRSDKVHDFVQEGCGEFRKIVEDVDRYLKPIKIAKSIIEKKHNKDEDKINKVKEEAQKYKAHAYAYQQKTRELSEEIKREIKNQTDIFPVCPYCEQSLGNEPHADHIYPVTLGGLGTIRNMVYVCSTCNQSKSSLTLREFIKKKNLDRDRVERNLSLLEKTF